MKKIYIDSDVLLDIYLNRELFVDNSSAVLSMIEEKVFKGYTSSVIIANLYYSINKYIGHDEAIGILKDLRLDLQVLSVSDATIDKALNSDFKRL